MSDAPTSAGSRRKSYRTGDAAIDAAIEEVGRLLPDGDERATRFAREIMTTAAKLVLDGADLADIKLSSSALKELRYAFKVFKPWRSTRKVTVFGSARTAPSEAAYIQATEFGKRMAALRWMVITGAGGGIMAAAHGGAGRGASFGVNIQLPFEQHANETVRGDDKLVNFKYFFTRKLTFLKETDAIVLFPGGFGTHDEGFETLTLIQTGKADPMPVVFIEPPGSGYWLEWHAYVQRHLGRAGLISPQDTRLYMVCDDINRAIDEVVGFYRIYHSQRYVGTKLVLRLQSQLSDDRVAELEAEFGHILSSGGIEQRGPLPEEENQPELSTLSRLVLATRRDDFAAVRMLIDRINQTPPSQARAIQHVGPHPQEERAERGAAPGMDSIVAAGTPIVEDAG